MSREQPAIERQRQALGTRIRDLRDHALLTQEDFAEMAGINRRTLQRIERGGDPRYSQLVRIAEVLGVSLADLVQE